MCKFSQTYTITNDMMDMDYVLTPVSAMMLFQDCFARYMETKYLAAFDVVKKNLYWIISEFTIDYDKNLPFWSEDIDVTVWISEVTKLRIYLDFELKHENKVFAKGNSSWFLLNIDTKKPVLTEIVTDKMPVCDELIIGEHQKFRLGDLDKKLSEVDHKVTISDLDFNNHVNNKSYIKIAATTIKNEYRESHSLKRLSVKYNREAFLDDLLHCETFAIGEENLFAHKLTRNGESVCEIMTTWMDKQQEEIYGHDLKARNDN